MLSSVRLFKMTNEYCMNKMVLSSLLLCHNFALDSAVGHAEPNPSAQPRWKEPKGFETDISIYNPILKKKSKLILQKENVVKWYSCGPTVYDSAHIGHAACYVKLDIIRRILMNVFDLNVFYLMGVTDIDDKIIMRSNEAKEDFKNLAQRYEAEFFKDLENLNVLPPTMTVKVSDHIPEIVSFVDTIMKKGFGYKTSSGSVYFDANGFQGYGKLSPPQMTDSPEKPNTEKRSPLDFSLWKAAKPQEPHWDSPWGTGRPGWHIECSAMASKVLGPQLDIHSGGQDLAFPHHENEEAQSCAHHNTSQWVNYWIHTGHLIAKDDVKMSKSLKNTISISQLLETHTSNHFRMMCLLSPYRNCIEYSSETMITAAGNCRRIESFIDECQMYLTGVKGTGVLDESAVIESIKQTRASVKSHLANDFDTSRAMDEILHFVTSFNTIIGKPAETSQPRSAVAVAAASQFVKKTLSDLGFSFASDQAGKADSKRLSAVLDTVVGFRSTVRETALHPDMAATVKPQRVRLLQACDSLRNSLADAGVEIKDHKGQKSTWSLKDIALPIPQSDT